jgi:hypothetical protein
MVSYRFLIFSFIVLFFVVGSVSAVTNSNVSLLSLNFPVSKFNISSTSFVNVSQLKYNSSGVTEKRMLSTFNVVKMSGTGANVIRARILVDGHALSEREVQNIDTSLSYASANIFYNFSSSNGQHTLTLQFRYTGGTGSVEISNFDMTLLGMKSSANNTINSTVFPFTKVVNGSFHNVLNFTMKQSVNADMFVATLFSASQVAPNDKNIFFLTNGVVSSPYRRRSIVSASDFASIGNGFIFSGLSHINNISIRAKTSPTSRTTSINGSAVDISLKDSVGNPIRGFAKSGPTNLSINETLTTGVVKNILNKSFVLVNGTGLFVTYYCSVQNTGGTARTSTMFLNVTNSSGATVCSTSKTKMTGGGDTGILMTMKSCDNLGRFGNYSIRAYIKTNHSAAFLDDGMSGFEVQQVASKQTDLPPIVAIVYPLNSSIQSQVNTRVNWTISDQDNDTPDHFKTNITLSNTTFKYILVKTFNGTITSVTNNTASLRNGIYSLKVVSCESDNTTSCGSSSIKVNISSTPALIRLNRPINGTVIFKGFVITNWSMVQGTTLNDYFTNVTFKNSSTTVVIAKNVSYNVYSLNNNTSGFKGIYTVHAKTCEISDKTRCSNSYATVNLSETRPIVRKLSPDNGSDIFTRYFGISWNVTDADTPANYSTNVTIRNSTKKFIVASALPHNIYSIMEDVNSIPHGLYTLILETCQDYNLSRCTNSSGIVNIQKFAPDVGIGSPANLSVINSGRLISNFTPTFIYELNNFTLNASLRNSTFTKMLLKSRSYPITSLNNDTSYLSNGFYVLDVEVCYNSNISFCGSRKMTYYISNPNASVDVRNFYVMYNATSIPLNYSISIYAHDDILNCSIYTNTTGTWGIIGSIFSPSNGSHITNVNPLWSGVHAGDVYIWNLQCWANGTFNGYISDPANANIITTGVTTTTTTIVTTTTTTILGPTTTTTSTTLPFMWCAGSFAGTNAFFCSGINQSTCLVTYISINGSYLQCGWYGGCSAYPAIPCSPTTSTTLYRYSSKYTTGDLGSEVVDAFGTGLNSIIDNLQLLIFAIVVFIGGSIIYSRIKR